MHSFWGHTCDTHEEARLADPMYCSMLFGKSINSIPHLLVHYTIRHEVLNTVFHWVIPTLVVNFTFMFCDLSLVEKEQFEELTEPSDPKTQRTQKEVLFRPLTKHGCSVTWTSCIRLMPSMQNSPWPTSVMQGSGSWVVVSGCLGFIVHWQESIFAVDDSFF